MGRILPSSMTLSPTVFVWDYVSPLGVIRIAADDLGLVGLWFEGEMFYPHSLPENYAKRKTPILSETIRWLDVYFKGEKPDFTPLLRPQGSVFRLAVWKLLLRIPYGTTTTYGEIARRLKTELGIDRTSAQAVGGAVGHNEISIIIPCHRVVGANGSLTGYAGGLDKKIRLLALEKVDVARFSMPKER
ncbi:MAG: methylated-DNA--[protein]-cysteine S-methyltransferase [Thermoguttaceae bacterium]